MICPRASEHRSIRAAHPLALAHPYSRLPLCAVPVQAACKLLTRTRLKASGVELAPVAPRSLFGQISPKKPRQTCGYAYVFSAKSASKTDSRSSVRSLTPLACRAQTGAMFRRLYFSAYLHPGVAWLFGTLTLAYVLIGGVRGRRRG